MSELILKNQIGSLDTINAVFFSYETGIDNSVNCFLKFFVLASLVVGPVVVL